MAGLTSMSSLSSAVVSLAPPSPLEAQALLPALAPLLPARGRAAYAEAGPAFDFSADNGSAQPLRPITQDAWLDWSGKPSRPDQHESWYIQDSNGWLDQAAVISWPAPLGGGAEVANLGDELTKMLMATTSHGLPGAAEPDERGETVSLFSTTTPPALLDPGGPPAADSGVAPRSKREAASVGGADALLELPPLMALPEPRDAGDPALLLLLGQGASVSLPTAGMMSLMDASSGALPRMMSLPSLGSVGLTVDVPPPFPPGMAPKPPPPGLPPFPPGMAPVPPPSPGPPLPEFCQPGLLTAGLDVELSAPPGDAAGLLAFGAGGVSMRVDADGYGDGVAYQRAFDALYLSPPDATGAIEATVATKTYIAGAQTIARPPPTALHAAVLRTPSAHVDRVRIRVDYQLRDATGNVRTAAPSSSPRLLLTMGDLSATVTCNRDELTSDTYMLRSCAMFSLEPAWFLEGGTAQVSIAVTLGGVESVADAGELMVVAQPSWYGDLGSTLLGAGVFAKVPIAPQYAYEEVTVTVYAHTGAFTLSTWTVYLNYDSATMEYVDGSAAGSPRFINFNAADRGTYVRLGAVGRAAGVTDGQTRSAALELATLRLRFRGAPSAAAYGGLSVEAALFVNPGGNSYLGGTSGAVKGAMLDGRGWQSPSGPGGQVVVKNVAEAGLFALLPTGTLANTALLTNAATVYTLAVATVTDRDDASVTAAAVSGAACATSAPSTVLSSFGCELQLDAAADQAATDLSITASYGSFSASASFSVWVPSDVSVSVEDPLLHRLAYASGGTFACETQQYQQTKISATVDGLDATPLVSFVSSDPATVAVQAHDTLQGLKAGSAEVYLGGRPTTRVAVEVTEAVVTAVSLTSRVVTAVAWSPRPPAAWDSASFVAAAMTSQDLTAEGHFGLLFAQVEWSDGHTQYVEQAGAGSALAVTSQTANVVVTAPGATAPAGSGSTLGANGEAFWRAEVAFGASRECSRNVTTVWSVCGLPMLSGDVPLHLALPDAVSLQLTASRSRLTAPGDDATLLPSPPGPLSSSTRLTLRVSFDGVPGTTDISTDPRTVYELDDPACATISDGNLLAVRAGTAATCTSVTVTATAYGLSATATVPLVFLDRLAIAFDGYPSGGELPITTVGSGDAAVVTTQLGVIECLPGTFHHARARTTATLTDASSYDVTSGSEFVSDEETVVLPAGARMQALGVGMATITTNLVGGAERATATLLIFDSVLTAAQSLAWNVPLQASSTLLAEQGGTRATTVALTFDNGVIFPDVADLSASRYAGTSQGGTYTPWLDQGSALVDFGTTRDDVVNVSSAGTLTLLDNFHEAVDVRVVVTCAEAVSTTIAIKANLHPKVDDVDLGARTGFQFSQSGSTLAVEMRMRVSPSESLSAFQIEVGPFEVDEATQQPLFLTSDTAAGASYVHATGGAAFRVPAMYTLNNPAKYAVVGSTDVTSTASGLVDIGTLTLGVVGSDVVLVFGRVVAATFTAKSGGALRELSCATVPAEDCVNGKPRIVAGQGYAALSLGRRRRQLGGADALQAVMAPRALARRRALAAALAASPSTGKQVTRSALRTIPGEHGFVGRRLQGGACGSCEVDVWGDFSGDCEFNTNDVLQLQLLQAGRNCPAPPAICMRRLHCPTLSSCNSDRT